MHGKLPTTPEDRTPLQRMQSLALWTNGHLPPDAKPLATLALQEADSHLVPAGKDVFRAQLTACLALTSGSGMSDAQRKEWLAVAWATLRETPEDLLRRGCDVARRYADHPSKIVPAIVREIETSMAERRKARGRLRELLAPPPPMPWERHRANPERVCSPEEAKQVLAETGFEPSTDYCGTRKGATVEQYEALGLSREEAEAAVQMQRAEQAKWQSGSGQAFAA